MTDQPSYPTDQPHDTEPGSSESMPETTDFNVPVDDAESTSDEMVETKDPSLPVEQIEPLPSIDDETPEEAEALEAEAPEDSKAEDQPPEMEWYILKVQSNREDTIRDGLRRRLAIAGLEDDFGEIIVPIEMVTEFKAGKKRVTKRKLYPGYLVVQMILNDDTWFLVRETPGIGDFTGAAGHPTPMLPHEVERIKTKTEKQDGPAPKLKISFLPGDHVKVMEGNFENFEGDVESIDETNGRVTVLITIFGRSTPVEFEYWQIETI